MKIYVTFDYELYFGDRTGSVERCILQPTCELIRIGMALDVRFVFFVDCGFIVKMEEYRDRFPAVEADYQAMVAQMRQLHADGHDLQLHIHPHWEDSVYDGKEWVMNVSRYKLADFSDEEIEVIVRKYSAVLESVTGRKPIAYRAGGWCLQPFDRIDKALRAAGVKVDSTVFRNGYFSTEQYAYDFRTAPDKDIYRFGTDPLVEEVDGYYTELPISPIRNSPLFFWKLFLLGRMDPFRHKPLGDGRAMAAPGYRKKLLTRFSNNPVSVDGYNASLLSAAFRKLKRKAAQNMVIIGHPKALSRFSVEALEKFVQNHKGDNSFTTFSREFR